MYSCVDQLILRLNLWLLILELSIVHNHVLTRCYQLVIGFQKLFHSPKFKHKNSIFQNLDTKTQYYKQMKTWQNKFKYKLNFETLNFEGSILNISHEKLQLRFHKDNTKGHGNSTNIWILENRFMLPITRKGFNNYGLHNLRSPLQTFKVQGSKLKLHWSCSKFRSSHCMIVTQVATCYSNLTIVDLQNLETWFIGPSEH